MILAFLRSALKFFIYISAKGSGYPHRDVSLFILKIFKIVLMILPNKVFYYYRSLGIIDWRLYSGEYMFCINLSQVLQRFSIRSSLEPKRKQYQPQNIKVFSKNHQPKYIKVYQNVNVLTSCMSAKLKHIKVI